jgi:hypothetical protein
LLCITDNAEADLAINRRSSKCQSYVVINFIGTISQHHIHVQSLLVKRDDNWRVKELLAQSWRSRSGVDRSCLRASCGRELAKTESVRGEPSRMATNLSAQMLGVASI